MGLHQVAEKCNRIHGHYSSYLVYTVGHKLFSWLQAKYLCSADSCVLQVQNVGMNSAGIAAPTIGLS
jgi:hypothetical protein